MLITLLFAAQAAAQPQLSWEKNHTERKAWTSAVYTLLDKELLPTFDKAKDANRICASYPKLKREQKLQVWAELISAVSHFESDWDPTSRMVETTMGLDPVTHAQVASEGLLQLSYQDLPNYKLTAPACRIDYAKDKALDLKDAKRTILDPVINLECGLRILAHQIAHKGAVILEKGVYWAVLREGGKKLNPILSMVAETGLCDARASRQAGVDPRINPKL